MAAEFKAADLGGAPEVLGALGASSEEATDVCVSLDPGIPPSLSDSNL